MASQPSSPVLRGMCGAGRTTDALVATDGEAVIGHAMAADSVEPDGRRVADIGLVVTDLWQRQGVGTLLLSCLASRATARDVRTLTMDVMPENRPMLAVIFRTWADAAWEFAPDAVTVRVSLDRPAASLSG
jgi:GNAT superfamily N-acetyltransferase